MSDEADENRLWQIETGREDRERMQLWPLIIIVLLGAVLIGALSFPCAGLRIDYLMQAPDDAPMNVLKMVCEGEGYGCVCRQTADSMTGGQDCEVGTDLVIRCRTVGAEEIR